MKESKLFQKPMTIFQSTVNDIVKDNPVNDLIKDLIKLNMLKNSEKDDKQLVLVELYNLLGTEKFMEVIELLSGKTVKFPTKSDFKETIQIALCYYLRQYRDLSWDEIKEVIQDDELSSVKLGVRVQQLQRFIEHYNENRIKKEILENGRRVD